MDSYEGNTQDPLSLHKYLYCNADPVNGIDPSGLESIFSVSTMGSIFSSLASLPNISPSQGVTSSGDTCGPDITEALKNTMNDIKQTFLLNQPAQRERAADNVFKAAMFDGWDMDLLAELGFGGTPDFGNHSSLGIGLGSDTVQVTIGGSQKVYYGGSVNYAMWGEMFDLIQTYTKYKGAAYSEASAVIQARAAKGTHGDFNSLYAQEAGAFVKYGFSLKNPSSTALTLKPNPKNVGSPNRFKWKWIGIHDTLQ